MNRLPDAVEEQRRRRYRQLYVGEPDLLPPVGYDDTQRLIDAYPDEERQDWMRRQLEIWRGRR